MVSRKEILEKESSNPGNIILFREGAFLRAYEHSAWALNLVQPLLASRRHVAVCGTDIVSVGFPASSLEKWRERLGNCVEEMENGLVFRSTAPFDDAAFKEWKKSVPLRERKSVKKEKSATEKDSPVEEILSRIRSFDLAVRTPLECMSFLSELKTILSRDGGE